MTLDGLDMDNVKLVADKLWMEQEEDMNLFFMTSFALQTDPKDSKQVRMVMSMKRKITSEMMTTYFPSLLLIAITFATTFFKPFFFEAALSVNLTTMLVMTTIFISKMESLPPTSDIKMIDIWLILCQIYPFVEVVLLTAMEYQREEESGKRKKKRKNSVQLVDSISSVDKNENPKTRWDELADFVSGWKAPGLKTLGKFLAVQDSSIGDLISESVSESGHF